MPHQFASELLLKKGNLFPLLPKADAKVEISFIIYKFLGNIFLEKYIQYYIYTFIIHKLQEINKKTNSHNLTHPAHTKQEKHPIMIQKSPSLLSQMPTSAVKLTGKEKNSQK